MPEVVLVCALAMFGVATLMRTSFLFFTWWCISCLRCWIGRRRIRTIGVSLDSILWPFRSPSSKSPVEHWIRTRSFWPSPLQRRFWWISFRSTFCKLVDWLIDRTMEKIMKFAFVENENELLKISGWSNGNVQGIFSFLIEKRFFYVFFFWA